MEPVLGRLAQFRRIFGLLVGGLGSQLVAELFHSMKINYNLVKISGGYEQRIGPRCSRWLRCYRKDEGISCWKHAGHPEDEGFALC